MTELIRVKVEGAKEAILGAFTRSRKYVRDTKDLTNYGVLVILVDEYNRPVVLDKANLDATGIVSACHAIALQESISLIVESSDEEIGL